MPVNCSVISFLQNGWAISTTNKQADPFSTLATALPQHLLMFYPDLPPAVLLQFHLKQRDEVQLDLGIEAMPDLSAEAYLKQ